MKTRILALTILSFLFIIGCNDDEDTIPPKNPDTPSENTDVSTGIVNMVLPSTLENATTKELLATIKNINSGELLTKEVNELSLSDLELEDGIYNMTVTGKADYITSYVVKKEKEDGSISEETVTKNVTSDIRGVKENIEIKGGSFSVSIPLFLVSKSSGFVISEVFFAGSKTPVDDKQYQDGEQFIELYNNTNEILYADGLCIAETELNSAMSLNEYQPDIREEATPVSSVYRIKGNGKDFPVEPGKTIVIADVAIDHLQNNSNSVDLSKADFEWFDGADVDVDVPEIPNMEKMVSTSQSVWFLHNRGYTGYILFKPESDITPEQFTSQNAYSYKYHFVFGTFEKWMDFDAWKVPNNWIVDAVQCSTPSAYEWAVMSPSLDITWTHSGDSDDARYGHSVKRKISHMEGERVVLQDTNDSASDFIATAPNPSPGEVTDHK